MSRLTKAILSNHTFDTIVNVCNLTLNFSNYLQTAESVKELSGCNQLSVLDLSANKLEESGNLKFS